MGAKITEFADWLEIQGGYSLTGAEVYSDTDHRIAISLAIAALRAKGETVIHRAEAAAISYPTFVETLKKVCHAWRIPLKLSWFLANQYCFNRS